MKPSPVALERFQLQPQHMQLPLTAESCFANPNGGLSVEIGFGGAEYLAYLAKTNPNHNYIGIELPPESITRGTRLMLDQAIENVRFIHGDARYLLRELFAPQSLDYVLMQFPMPWPKDRHAKHRIISPMLAETLSDVLKLGAKFELVSDQQWYAEDGHRFLSENPYFDVAELETNPPRPFLTRYEKKWQADNRDTFRVVATKTKHFDAPRLILNSEMDFLTIAKLPTKEQLRQLVNTRFRDDRMSAQVKEVMSIDNGFVLRMVAADDSYSQFFFTRIRERKDGSCVISIDDSPYPFYTPAVRFANQQLHAQLV